MKNTLRIATRKSALAMWQANHVQSLLREAHAGIEIELVPIVTQGDRILDRPLSEIGGKGLFLKELEYAMLNGEADLAVHSMKDVPADMAKGLVLDAVLPRANPFASRIGTSSLRRRSLLLATRPDLEVADLRGNVDTRLRKLDEGQYDAIILACAGLQRLGLGNRITQSLQPPDWLPASTQGIIGLQCRQDDNLTRSLIERLADADTMVVASAERAVARVLEATCQVPLAVFAVLDDGVVTLRSVVSTSNGRELVQAKGRAPASDAVALGEQVAADLLKNGAGDIIAAL